MEDRKPPTYEELQQLLSQASALMAKQSACIQQLQAEIAQLRGEVSHLNTTNNRQAEEVYQLEQEVLYWRFFIDESRRVFRDKKGLYGEMLDRALKLLHEDCTLYAYAPESFDEQEEPAKQFPKQMALVSKIQDDRLRKKWGMMRDMDRIVRRYGELTGYPTNRRPTEADLARRELLNGALGRKPFLDREEAIKVITKEFKYGSPSATYKALQRARVKYLPPTWPKA